MMKKINHISIGKEARKAERKQHHRSRMVDWKFLIM